jgi:DNA-directed RNA polymerase specialized sigma24 family protein
MEARLARRHERAFERSYRRHAGDVYHYTLGVLRDPLAAEQVTQTTFLNAYREFRRLGGRAPGLNSLLALAHDVCRLRSGYPGLEDLDFFIGEEFTRAADVRRALACLPFNRRAALVMREVEGRSYAEIAEILGLSVGAVETLIFQARQELRMELEGSFSCHEAELAVSRELDDRLSRKEKRLLRAHLRVCEECRAFAQGQQAQREAIRALAAIPLPATLESFFGARRASFGLGTVARLTALAGTTALVVALVSSSGLPHPASFIGQEPEPEVDAAVVKRAHTDRTKAKKAKKAKKAQKSKKTRRKFHRPATSP